MWDLKQFTLTRVILLIWLFEILLKSSFDSENHWNISFDCHFNVLNRKQGIFVDKVPLIFYSEEVIRQKVYDTCQKHVQDNSEQNKIETKIQASFQKLAIFKNKIFLFEKLIVKLHLNVCKLKTSKGSKVSTSYKTSNDFGKSCFTNLLPH